MSGGLLALQPRFIEKVWGTPETKPWFDSGGKKIGEVWLTAQERPLPILVKFLFTSESLSVQVHPDDEYARIRESSPGKTEMWYILRAEPNAAIALGLRSELSRDQLRRAAQSGEIESYLHWVTPHRGDSFLIPAGTIHALGAGIALCEIQQPSDMTYRLYDYGRPRELHLQKALEVADLRPYSTQAAPVVLSAEESRLIACPYFTTDCVTLESPYTCSGHRELIQLWIALEGRGYLSGKAFSPGMAWCVPPNTDPFEIRPEGSAVFLCTYRAPG